MITYNTTFMLAPELEGQFLQFLREVYVPGIVGQAVLSNPQLKRIARESGEEDALSLALSFEAESGDALIGYLGGEGVVYPMQLIQTFGEQVVGFTTIMEHIEL